MDSSHKAARGTAGDRVAILLHTIGKQQSSPFGFAALRSHPLLPPEPPSHCFSVWLTPHSQLLPADPQPATLIAQDTLVWHALVPPRRRRFDILEQQEPQIPTWTLRPQTNHATRFLRPCNVVARDHLHMDAKLPALVMTSLV